MAEEKSERFCCLAGSPCPLLPGLLELLFHRGIATGKLLDGEVVGLVVGQTEVVLGAEKIILDFLEKLDGVINLFDGLLELLAGETVIPSESILEGLKLFLEVCDIDALLTGESELLLHADSVLGRVDQQGDHRLEELGSDDVHLRILVRHVHDAAVVELAVGLKERHEHGVLAALRVAIGIELFEEVLVFVLGGCLIHLVLHLEHNGDVLDAILVVAEDEVALAASGRIVVLLEVGVGEHRPHLAVEDGAAVGFQALADHFGGQARLEILQALDLLFGNAHACVGLELGQLDVRAKLGNLRVLRLRRFQSALALLEHSILQRLLVFANGGLEGGNLLVLLGQFSQMSLAGLGLSGQLLGFLLLVQFLDAAIHLVVEFCVLDLVHDGSVVRFIHGKNISALGAFEFSHIVDF